jgi:hypothetical protein
MLACFSGPARRARARKSQIQSRSAFGWLETHVEVGFRDGRNLCGSSDMQLSDAFRWPGGPELIVDLTLDRGGRHADLREIVDVFQKMRWTAAVAEMLALYASWLMDRNSNYKGIDFVTFDSWIQSLPDPRTAEPTFYIDAETYETSEPMLEGPTFDSYFDRKTIYDRLVLLVGPINNIGTYSIIPPEYRLLLQLYYVIHENPTKARMVIAGSLLSVALAAAVIGGVAYSMETHSDTCRAQVSEMYTRQLEIVMKQAKLQGNTSPELSRNIEKVVKGSTAAINGCQFVFPHLKISINPKTWLPDVELYPKDEAEAESDSGKGTKKMSDAEAAAKGREVLAEIFPDQSPTNRRQHGES